MMLLYNAMTSSSFVTIFPIFLSYLSLSSAECTSSLECIRGICSQEQTVCVCDSYFLGTSCERVDLSTSVTSVGSTSAVFVWDHKMDLSQYKFIYMHHKDIQRTVMFEKETQPYKNGIIIKFLKPSSSYIMCVSYHNNTFAVYKAFLSNSSLKGCVLISTSQDNSQILKTAAIVVGFFLIFCVVVIFAARIVYLYTHRKTITIKNIPKVTDDKNVEEAIFDFLDGTLQMGSSRDMIVFKTVSKETSKAGTLTDSFRVEFFSSADRNEVYRLAKLQNDRIAKSNREVTGTNVRHSNSLNVSDLQNTTNINLQEITNFDKTVTL